MNNYYGMATHSIRRSDSLRHYGVKGQKWGVVHEDETSGGNQGAAQTSSGGQNTQKLLSLPISQINGGSSRPKNQNGTKKASEVKTKDAVKIVQTKIADTKKRLEEYSKRFMELQQELNRCEALVNAGQMDELEEKINLMNEQMDKLDEAVSDKTNRKNPLSLPH